MPKYAGVYQLPDGSWGYRLRITIDGKVTDTERRKDPDGKAFLTARAAYEAKVDHERRLRGAAGPKKKSVTVDEIYKMYLASADGRSKAPATIRKQDSIMRNHISPQFGSRAINSITIAELDSYLYDKYQHLSYRFVEGHLKMWYLLFGFADKCELVDKDRYYRMFVDHGTRLGMPKKSQSDVEDDLEGADVYSDYDLADIKRVLSSEDGNLLVSYYIGIYTGVRVSECFALRWSDIDWSERKIRVARQMHYQRGRLELAPVKTMTSLRYVPMPRTLAEFLLSYYERQVEDRKRLGQSYRDTERVYDSVTKEWIQGGDFIQRKRDGLLLTVNSVKYWAKRIKEVTGIEFKYHNLRHTFATNCALNNLNIMLVMQWLGHKKVDTTRKYYLNVDNAAMLNKALAAVDSMYDLDAQADEPEWDPSDEERRFVMLQGEEEMAKRGWTLHHND